MDARERSEVRGDLARGGLVARHQAARGRRLQRHQGAGEEARVQTWRRVRNSACSRPSGRPSGCAEGVALLLSIWQWTPGIKRPNENRVLFSDYVHQYIACPKRVVLVKKNHASFFARGAGVPSPIVKHYSYFDFNFAGGVRRRLGLRKSSRPLAENRN